MGKQIDFSGERNEYYYEEMFADAPAIAPFWVE